jgi:hypothetical protein
MALKKFTPEEIRQQDAVKRRNQSLKPGKMGEEETRNDDGNNVQEGYDEQEYTAKEIEDEKRSKGE